MKVMKCIAQNGLGEFLESYGPNHEEVDALLNGMRGRKAGVTAYVLKFHNGYRIEIDRELATLISPDGHKRFMGAVNYATLPEEVRAISRYC